MVGPADIALVDEADYELVRDRKWFAAKRGATTYAACNTKLAKNRWTPVYMHRLILGAKPGEYCDHLNGDGLDNRRANLRLCTHAANLQNCRKRSGCSSRYVGVHWHRAAGKWQATIRINGKRRYLGLHESEDVAGAAYSKALLEFRGHLPRAEIPNCTDLACPLYPYRPYRVRRAPSEATAGRHER